MLEVNLRAGMNKRRKVRHQDSLSLCISTERLNRGGEVMAQLLGRNLTAMEDMITMTRATSSTTPCEFLIFVPFQCITERQTNRESSITISVEDEECNKLLKLCRARQNNNDNILCIVVGGGTLRKLISSLMGGLHAGDALPVFLNPRNATAVILSALPCMRFLRPITTCLLEGSSDSQWSSLPTLVLWMIKDRLDFFNNANVALVCRHWWHASINYPTKMQTVGDGIPWIMLDASVDGNKCVRDFINLERTKKFSVELPEFYNARQIFSKQGWILFGRRKVDTRDRLVVSLFLINPLTKGKIQLADLELKMVRSGLYRGCFSISKDGFPNCVVIFCGNYGKKISLYITYPGGESDQMWTQQSYVGKEFNIVLLGLTVIGSLVYYLNDGGGMMIYDMVGQSWKEIPHPLPLIDRWSFRLMEFEGEVRILGFGRCVLEGSLFFFKYSDAHNSWQRYNDDAVNLSIFEHGLRSNALSIPIQKGQKFYSIPGGVKKNRLFYIDRLAAETSPISFTLHDSPTAIATWVDIG